MNQTIKTLPRVIPESYALEINNGFIQLKLYGQNLLKGYTVVESVPYNTGKSLAGLRKSGEQKAKRFKVPFYDRTQGA